MTRKTAEYRDPFEEWDQAIGQSSGEDPLARGSGYKRPMDYIPAAKVRLRSRRWEKRNKARSFRRVPPNVPDSIRMVARNESLTVDDVADALLDYALTCYQRNELKLEPELSEQRRTLMPERGWDGRSRLRWLEERWNPKPPRQTPAKAKLVHSPQPWKDWPIVAYRLSPKVVKEIDAIRGEKSVPAGEVFTRLIMHAMNAYQDGKLVLNAENASEQRPTEADWRPT